MPKPLKEATEPTLARRIDADTVAALKSGDAVRVGTLRLLRTVLHNREIEKHGKGDDAPLSDAEVLDLIGREIKKRREAIELYGKAGRTELVTKEQGELKILEVYLPPQMGEAEVRNAVEAAVLETGAAGPKDFGRAMGVLAGRLKGKTDATLIARILKNRLGG